MAKDKSSKSSKSSSKSKDKHKSSKSKDKTSKSSKSKDKSKRTRKPLDITPVKEKFTMSGLLQYLETLSGVEKKHVKKVLKALEGVMLGSIHRKGRGEFMYPSMFKIIVKDIPARKGGEKKKNPFTGEMMVTKAKPATKRVKLRGMSKLKKAALA